jgi:hypothetical protein
LGEEDLPIKNLILSQAVKKLPAFMEACANKCWPVANTPYILWL